LAEFKNPQQEPGAERRLLLVFLLTFIVLIIFQPLLKKYMPQPPAPQPRPQNQTVLAQPAAASSVPTPSALPTVTTNTATKQASTEAETVIENDLYRITFTNRGAQVKSWILKKFDNDAQNGLLDLVSPAVAQKYGNPLSLWTYDETLRNRLNSVLYVASSEGQLSAPAQITFEYADQDLVVRKTFRFDHTYVLNVEISVAYKGAEIFARPHGPPDSATSSLPPPTPPLASTTTATPPPTAPP
jgi:YidC/Oxa1 family membrane protein insertase